jgi:type VI secretion system secreted protein VgrG
VITAGGSQLKIDGSGVFPTTSGKFEVKAGQHVFKGGAEISMQVPILPEMDNPYILQYLVKNKDNEVLVNKPYLIIDENGNIQKGITDSKGFMTLKKTSSAQIIAARVMVNEIEEAEDAVKIDV